jgi:hypothetical protein
VSGLGIRHCHPQPSARFSTDRQRPSPALHRRFLPTSPTRHFSEKKTRISYCPFHKQAMEY